MDENLTAKTIRGLNWSYVSTIANSAVQIVFTAIMARLLDPSAFGLVALAGVVLRFGSYFAQMGIGPALIQKREISKEEIRAAFTMAILLSFLFSAVIWVAAPLAARLLDEPDLEAVIRVLVLSFLLNGLSVTALSLLRRKLEFRSLAIIEVFSFLLGYGCVGIALAYSGFGVWSLVIASLSQSALSALLSYLYVRHSLSFILGWRYYERVFSFGSRVTIISFLEFLTSNLDTLAIGRFLGATPVGLYNRAFMLVNLPMQYVTTGVSRVLLPSFSSIQTEIPRLKRAYLSSVMFLAALLVPTCIGIAVSSREIVLLILGKKWTGAIPVLQILALATPFNLLSVLGGIVCEATATLKPKALIQVAHLGLLLTLFYFARGLGITGFAMAVVIAETTRHAMYVLLMSQMFKIDVREMFRSYQPAFFSALLAGFSIYGLASFMRHLGLPVGFVMAAEVILGITIFILSIFSPPQRAMRDEIQMRFFGPGGVVDRDTISGRMLGRFEKIFLVKGR